MKGQPLFNIWYVLQELIDKTCLNHRYFFLKNSSYLCDFVLSSMNGEILFLLLKSDQYFWNIRIKSKWKLNKRPGKQTLPINIRLFTNKRNSLRTTVIIFSPWFYHKKGNFGYLDWLITTVKLCMPRSLYIIQPSFDLP